MVWDFHSERIEDTRRVFKCHRGALSIILPSPAAIGDFVWTSFSECLIHENTLRLFEKNGFTGFLASRVVIERFKRKSGKGSRVQKLFELDVYGDGGSPHPSSGSIRLMGPDEMGISRYSSFKNGLLVNERTWDGSDFFTLDGWRSYIFVTERVKDLIVKEKMSNCVLIRVEDMRWPSYLTTPEEEFHQQHLEDLMKEANETPHVERL
jgi:hypothetical protein